MDSKVPKSCKQSSVNPDVSDDEWTSEEEIDESDIYSMNPWSGQNDEISGYSFKGKDPKFVKALENIKIKLKKGFARTVNGVEIKVSNSKAIPHGIERDVSISKESHTGKAKLAIYEQNLKKKNISMVVKKAKESDEKFIEILAKEVIKPMIDLFIKGQGWAGIIDCQNEVKTKIQCDLCGKEFVTVKNVQVHKKKFHEQNKKENQCSKCGNHENEGSSKKKHPRCDSCGKNDTNCPKISAVDPDFKMRIRIRIQAILADPDPDPIRIQVISMDRA